MQPPTTVIQADQGGDDLLIGDLLSLDIPTGPPINMGGGGGGGLADLDLLGADLGGLGVSTKKKKKIGGGGGGVKKVSDYGVNFAGQTK